MSPEKKQEAHSPAPRIKPLTNLLPGRFVTLSNVSQYALLTPIAMTMSMMTRAQLMRDASVALCMDRLFATS